MAARHTIWKWAGTADDWWGRIKVLTVIFSFAASGLFALWALYLQDLSVAALVVLGLAVLFALLAVTLAVKIWGPRAQGSEPEAVSRDPEIAFFLPEPPCTRHPLEHNGVQLGRDAIYCHLDVKSVTGETVRGCRAFLRRVARVENHEYVDDARFTRPLRLKWANFMPDDPRAEVNDIDADDPSLLDIVAADEATPGQVSIVTLDTGPIGIPKVFSHGMYRLTIRVTPEKSASVDHTFLLAVPDQPAFGAVLSSYIEGPPPAPPVVPSSPAMTGVATTATTYTGGTVLPGDLAGPTGPAAIPLPPSDE